MTQQMVDARRAEAQAIWHRQRRPLASGNHGYRPAHRDVLFDRSENVLRRRSSLSFSDYDYRAARRYNAPWVIGESRKAYRPARAIPTNTAAETRVTPQMTSATTAEPEAIKAEPEPTRAEAEATWQTTILEDSKTDDAIAQLTLSQKIQSHAKYQNFETFQMLSLYRKQHELAEELE